MQERLGIQVLPDEVHSENQLLPRPSKVLQLASDLPIWTGKDAVKVCSLCSLYRLVDACAFSEGIVPNPPAPRPRRELRIQIGTKQSEVCSIMILSICKPEI